MRIGVIGGGIAGLTTSWLLADNHEVTLFEAQPCFGGHARTVVAHLDDAPVFVDAGFEFFAPQLWPTFSRLLEHLGVEIRRYRPSVSVFRPGSPDAFVLPPTLGDLRRLSLGAAARRVVDLAQLGLVLGSATGMMRARDTSMTVGRAIDRLPLTRHFRDEFLLPYLLGGWCVEPDEFREFAAYDVLRYTFATLSRGRSLPMSEVVGGTRVYVEALLRALGPETVRPSAAVEGVARDGGGLLVRERGGAVHRFDHVVLATNARDAAALLAGLEGTERVRAALGRIAYFRTTIAVHGDRRLMAHDPRDWATVNVRHDGHHAQTTIYKPWRSKTPVFRSWVTYDAHMPEPLHELASFDHPKVTPAYFETQRALNAMQGLGGVWLAGMHMHDIDSHESALVSAVHVVEGLSPAAPRLRVLAPPKPRW